MATISDVARRAGVSTVTVSRVINDERHVSAATRARVEQAIAELGYVPNVVARSLRSKRTRTLALIVPDITNVFWTTVARGVEDTAQGFGYSVLFCNTDEDPDKQQRYLQVVASQRVDGVMIAPCDDDQEKLKELRTRNVPTVLIDRRVRGWDADSVLGDSVGGARALVRHLIGIGHRRIAMISGPEHASTADERIAGYSLALTEAGIPVDPELIKRGGFRASYGERLIYELLETDPRPTAVFAANNVIALGVAEGLAKRGLRIPQDMALVCYDDLPDASILYPFLTATVQPAYDMGMHAAQLLVSRLESETPLQPRHVVLPTRLMIRYSCGVRKSLRDDAAPSLPVLLQPQTPGILIKPFGAGEARAGSPSIVSAVPKDAAPHRDRPDVSRLIMALRRQEPDRVPLVEPWIRSKAVCEYVLERELKYLASDAADRTQTVAPEDQVEFAQRLGLDAVVCSLPTQPLSVSDAAQEAASSTASLVLMADQIGCVERHLRAAHGTGVGVGAGFDSFFAPVWAALGSQGFPRLLAGEPALVESLLDLALRRQERALRTICDRFADQLAFVLIEDSAAAALGCGLPPGVFARLYVPRMHGLLAPAREHGVLTVFHSPGNLDGLLPTLCDVGFDAVHVLAADAQELSALKSRWGDRLALIGNVAGGGLARGTREEIERTVREGCAQMARGGGYVFCSAVGLVDGISPEQFVSLTRAVRRHGRYDRMYPA